MKPKNERRCPDCTKYNVNCTKINRTIPKYATECRQWSEKPQKPLKCKFCDGRGLTAIGNYAKGLEKCPMCNGTGEVDCRLRTYKEFLGVNEFEIREKS